MAVKYGTAPLDHAEETGLPVLSGHAHDMWDGRMPAEAVAAETALAEATRLTEIAEHGHWRKAGKTATLPDAIWVYRGVIDAGDEARAYTAAFVEENDTITTTLRASTMTHRPMAAYLRVAARLEGGHHE